MKRGIGKRLRRLFCDVETMRIKSAARMAERGVLRCQGRGKEGKGGGLWKEQEVVDTKAAWQAGQKAFNTIQNFI